MTVIGKYDSDGNIEIEADECAISGKPVLGEHSVAQRIKDTPYFYRYFSDYQHHLTDKKRAEIEALIPKSSKNTLPDKGKAKEMSEA